MAEQQLVYPVAVGGVDETRAFIISVVGEAIASLTSLRIECKQADGSWRTFDILAGELPTAAPGAYNLGFARGLIQATNVGNVPGTLFIRITDDTGLEIGYFEGYAVVGGSIVNEAVSPPGMPSRDYGITVEVGHI